MRIQSLPPVTLEQLCARRPQPQPPRRPSLACAKSMPATARLAARKPRPLTFREQCAADAAAQRDAKRKRINRDHNRLKVERAFPPGPNRDAAAALAEIIDGDIRI